MAINVIDDLTIGKGQNVTLNATASGISTNESNFKYQWRKRNSNSLPDKVFGVNGRVLTIPNVDSSDSGSYYCTVTNEWDIRLESADVQLTVFGM